MDEDRINQAIDACYDAVIDPQTWPDALHQLARATGAACAMFYPENPGILREVPASREYHDFLEHYMQGGWYANHYRAERGWPLLKAGRRVIIEHDLASNEERRRLRHYNELYLKWGFPGFAAVGFRLDGQYWCVPLLRGKSQGHFDAADAARLTVLAPHFRRMMKLSEQLAVERVRAGLQALEAIGTAAIVIGPEGRIIGMNADAERLLGKGLFVRNGTLATSDRAARDSLYRMVASIGSVHHNSDVDCEPVIIRRPETRPLVLDAVPARGLLADVLQCNGGLILITDLAAGARPAPERLRAFLGLTPAEARLAFELSSGDALDKAAARLGITKETARHQLKSVFQKTDVHRQAELVALLARLARVGQEESGSSPAERNRRNVTTGT